MSDPTSGEAPRLGAPTDTGVGDETAAWLLTGAARACEDDDGRDGRAAERTIDTPDDLGGAGGDQEGGVG